MEIKETGSQSLTYKLLEQRFFPEQHLKDDKLKFNVHRYDELNSETKKAIDNLKNAQGEKVSVGKDAILICMNFTRENTGSDDVVDNATGDQEQTEIKDGVMEADDPFDGDDENAEDTADSTDQDDSGEEQNDDAGFGTDSDDTADDATDDDPFGGDDTTTDDETTDTTTDDMSTDDSMDSTDDSTEDTMTDDPQPSDNAGVDNADKPYSHDDVVSGVKKAMKNLLSLDDENSVEMYEFMLNNQKCAVCILDTNPQKEQEVSNQV